MNTTINIIVNYEKDEVQVQFDGKDYQFKDLDSWIRTRFAIHEKEPLRYMNKLGEELVPSWSYLREAGRVYVKKIITSTNHQPDKFIWGLTQWNFSLTFLTLTTVILLAGLHGDHHPVTSLLPIKWVCNQFDELLIAFGLIHKNGVTLEALIAFICWSSTYIFVRRLWNPENFGTVIEKYAADSFFGGLAAGASVILKYVLLRSLA